MTYRTVTTKSRRGKRGERRGKGKERREERGGVERRRRDEWKRE